jgi:hypothetical protein
MVIKNVYMPKTKLEIINETVEYYSQDPENRRAKYDGHCVYQTSDHKMCAFGRVMQNPEKYINRISLSIIDIIKNFNSRSFIINPPIVKEEYAGHNRAFWGIIQNLHDNNWYWDKDKLSAIGEEEVKRIKSFYSHI